MRNSAKRNAGHCRRILRAFMLQAGFLLTIMAAAATQTAYADEHSDTRAGATNLPIGGQVRGIINSKGNNRSQRDFDYFRVRVTQSGTLTVYTTGGTDTWGALLASDGNSMLANNDDGGANNNFRIDSHVNPGTYYVSVEGYCPPRSGACRTGSYTVHASMSGTTPNPPTNPPPTSGDDHSDILGESATNLSIGGQVSGIINSRGTNRGTDRDKDVFRVRVTQSGTLTVYTTGGTDTYGTLFPSNGSALANNDDYGGNVNFRIRRNVSAGTYYVMVEGYCPRSGACRTGRYTVHASMSGTTPNPPTNPPPTSGDDHSDILGESATNLSIGGQVSGIINSRGTNRGTDRDKDVFRVRVTQSGTLTVYTTGGTDTYGTLFPSNGSALANNDDYGGNVNFRIRRNVSAGTYYVMVEGYCPRSGACRTGRYTVHASMSGTTPNPPTDPPPTRNFYGAFAVDPVRGSWGRSANRPSQASADSEAIRICQSYSSGRACRVDSRFGNGKCVAVYEGYDRNNRYVQLATRVGPRTTIGSWRPGLRDYCLRLPQVARCVYRGSACNRGSTTANGNVGPTQPSAIAISAK